MPLHITSLCSFCGLIGAHLAGVAPCTHPEAFSCVNAPRLGRVIHGAGDEDVGRVDGDGAVVVLVRVAVAAVVSREEDERVDAVSVTLRRRSVASNVAVSCRQLCAVSGMCYYRYS